MKIFQIGHHRCGTTSFHRFFNLFKIPSCHMNAGTKDSPLFLGKILVDNLANNKPLLSTVEHFVAYTDMEYGNNIKHRKVGYKLYQQLDQQYPDSLFILNNRPIDNWINSRLKLNGGNWAKNMAKGYNSHDEMLEAWKSDYHDHHKEVRDYFFGRDCLLDYDIENDNPSKLCDFFNPKFVAYGRVLLDCNKFPWSHKTI